MSIRLAAALLVGAFVVFLIGAGFWLLDEFEQPLAIRLRAVASRHVRWMWIHSWMFLGTLVSVAAVTVFARSSDRMWWALRCCGEVRLRLRSWRTRLDCWSGSSS